MPRFLFEPENNNETDDDDSNNNHHRGEGLQNLFVTS
jgi:hypothetical protein